MTDAPDAGEIELRHGPHQPHERTPARRPGSLRRTTSHTSVRPDGLAGDVVLSAHGRDLWTAPDGTATVVASASVDADVSFGLERALRSVRVDPPVPATDDLAGRRLSGGFRRAVETVFADDDRAASLPFQLLDDLPTAVLVSGVAVAAAGLFPPANMMELDRRAGICAGWVSGGTILVGAERLGHVPTVTGPVAPPLDTPGDTDAWHHLDPLPAHGMRRLRRIDVWPGDGAGAGTLAVEAFFRDSHMHADGDETVVHEYLISARVTSDEYVFLDCRAEIGVLPWFECPGAAASAERVVGTPAADLRSRIQATFTGPTTCTHLNDTLRALAALPFLGGWVAAGGRPERG